MQSRRAWIGGALVALLAMSGARVMDASASPAPRDGHRPSRHSNPVAAEPPAVEGSTLQQSVHLNVVGGSIDLETVAATVVLTRVPGSDRLWVGTLPSVRVVDARGTLEGWEVRWFLGSIELDGAAVRRSDWATVTVEPGSPAVVDGAPEGLQAGRPGPARKPGRTLFEAAPGTGGGTYESDGVVTVRLPGSVSADHATVNLTFALH